MWELSARKIRALERTYDTARGSPVYTVEGRWTSRGWTEWTQGFQYGSALLQFDATGEGEFLEAGRRHTVESMAAHVTHAGVPPTSASGGTRAARPTGSPRTMRPTLRSSSRAAS
jgi:hypothetical protein